MSEITGLSEIFGSDSENGENGKKGLLVNILKLTIKCGVWIEDSKEEIAPVGSADQSADSNEEEGTSENVKSGDEERPEEEASDAENSESDNNQETAKKSNLINDSSTVSILNSWPGELWWLKYFTVNKKIHFHKTTHKAERLYLIIATDRFLSVRI